MRWVAVDAATVAFAGHVVASAPTETSVAKIEILALGASGGSGGSRKATRTKTVRWAIDAAIAAIEEATDCFGVRLLGGIDHHVLGIDRR